MKIRCTVCDQSHHATGDEGIAWLKRIMKNDKCKTGKSHKWQVKEVKYPS